MSRTDVPHSSEPGGAHTHGIIKVDSQVGLISFPAILKEALFSCYFSVNTNMPPAYSTNYRKSRLGYFSLTFTYDLVVTYYTCVRISWANNLKIATIYLL